MQRKLILLSLINSKDVVAVAVTKEVIEAAVFWAIRAGAKKMMIVHSETYQLLAGDDEYKAAIDRGDVDAEVLLCDPASPAIADLAALNSDESRAALKEQKEYDYIDPREFVRDKEHSEYLPYDDKTDFEATTESYQKYGRIKPVYYIEFWDGNKQVKVTIDGWKYVVFARKAGIKKVFACKLKVGNADDLMSIMLQLQFSNHDSYFALFNMIQALWPKYCKGQGYRSDLDDEVYDSPLPGSDGKRLTVYERVAKELNLKPHQVKYIRRIGLTDAMQFVQMDTERVSLYKVYSECVRIKKGEQPPVPAVKPPVYHSTSTGAPQFTPPTNTGGSNVSTEYRESAESSQEPGEIPLGTVVGKTDGYIIVSGPCQHCGKTTLLRIPLNEIQ